MFPITLDDGIHVVVKEAVSTLSDLKELRKEIHGAIKPLNGIVKEADRLIRSLTLVRDVPDFHTTAVGQQAVSIMRMCALYYGNMAIMAAENRRMNIFEPKVLRKGDHETGVLENMLNRLTDARTVLVNQIIAIRVGLYGSDRDGFRISPDVLIRVNKLAKTALGRNLVIYDQLKDKLPVKAKKGHADDLIKLKDAEADAPDHPSSSRTMTDEWRATVGISGATGIAGAPGSSGIATHDDA
ncbi:hypothetical protein B0H63DRAFT_484070 [Podospora didyma]|uniref:Uncharacterized protein n=1 Tax=Podospora didyma TaxID=330526 RepID=A0AAE0N7E3_9PEZI|nr:hypothetical protein B0H63DRAFT_484070 [Podospora didyma]